MYVTVCTHQGIVLVAGLNVTEVAHDIQAQVSKYVSVTLGLVNSYDTWHGMLLFITTYIVYVHVNDM